MEDIVSQCDRNDQDARTTRTTGATETLPPLPKPTPRRDALERALEGTGLDANASSVSNPLTDPLWRSAEEYERARLTRAIIDYHEKGVLAPEMLGAWSQDGSVITLKDGTRLNLRELIDEQRREAYDMLRAGVDDKTVAACVFRDVEWVQGLRKEFSIY